MKQFLCSFAFVFLTAAPAFSQTDVTRAADEKALRYLKEVEWPKAYREQDTLLLDRILADEFKMVSSDGVWYSKQDELAYIKTHRPDYLSFRFEIKRLEIFENNTAVVAGTGIIRNRDAEGEFTVEYQSTNILIKRNGLWRAVASHTSGDKVIRDK